MLVSRIISIGGDTGKFAPEAGKARMRTAFFTRVNIDCVTNFRRRSRMSHRHPRVQREGIETVNSSKYTQNYSVTDRLSLLEW